jgi:hypothetical protein
MITELEYFGGKGTFDDTTNYLYFKRIYGIYSNITVLMHLLCDLKLRGIHPEKITLILEEYNNYDLYDGILSINTKNIEKWKTFDIDRVLRMRHNIGINLYGFGTSQSQIDLELTTFLLNTYFVFSGEVKNRAEEIKKEHNIITEDSSFIWWRKTDKIHEITWFKRTAKYPELSDAIKHLKSHKNVYAQTDDPNIFDEFSKYENINRLDIFNRKQYFTNKDAFKDGFHIENKKLTDSEFLEKYKISRKDYIINLMALVQIASECSQYIGYPGNISMVVSLVRGSFNNVVFFKDHEELF